VSVAWQTLWMGSGSAATYGDRHAPVYDRIYGSRFTPDAAVATLVKFADGGPLLELGVGTGRLAIPLAARGVQVDGIEGSAAMIEQLRARPGAESVRVFQADLARFDLARHDYSIAVCAVSTLFMLDGPRAQQSCVMSAAAHLQPGGLLLIEALRPDPNRFDADGRRPEQRPTSDGTHLVHGQHDPARQRIKITHVLSNCSELGEYAVELCYATEEQLDAMATAAGLELTARWHDWNGAPATRASRDPISVYRQTQGTEVTG
jgi:SAM-dependent methyltransferase